MREHGRASAWSLAQSGLSAWLFPHLSWGDSYSSLLRPENSTVHKVGTQATAVQAPSAGLRPRWFRASLGDSGVPGASPGLGAMQWED